MPSDELLHRRIQKAMVEDHRLSGHAVEVEVRNGVVRLNGRVQSHRRKLAVHELVASLEGCRDVINEITVEPSGVLPDEKVAENVRAALDAHADITREVITVAVHGGKVTLQGNVASPWERQVAEDVALAARGVRSVNNMIMIDPDQELEDEVLSRSIAEALGYTRALRDAAIEVAVNADQAVLSGEVEHFWQKQTAEDVARRFRVRTVRNEIRVTG